MSAPVNDVPNFDNVALDPPIGVGYFCDPNTGLPYVRLMNGDQFVDIPAPVAENIGYQITMAANQSMTLAAVSIVYDKHPDVQDTAQFISLCSAVLADITGNHMELSK